MNVEILDSECCVSDGQWCFVHSNCSMRMWRNAVLSALLLSAVVGGTNPDDAKQPSSCVESITECECRQRTDSPAASGYRSDTELPAIFLSAAGDEPLLSSAAGIPIATQSELLFKS